MIKKLSTLATVFILMSALAAAVWADGTSKKSYNEKEKSNKSAEAKEQKKHSFSVTAAGRYGDVEGDKLISGLSGGRVAEYTTVTNSPVLSLKFASDPAQKNAARFNALYLDKDEMDFGMNLDLSRIVQNSTTFDRFIHRLDHDPLTNVEPEAVYEFVFVDSNPTDDYQIVRNEAITDTDIKIPYIPLVKFNMKYRYMTRKGHQQGRTLDVCTVCHIDAQTREIDQRTADLILGAEAQVKVLNVGYSHMERKFEEKGPALIHYYTDPYRIFGFQGDNPFSLIPDSKRQTDKVKARVDLPRSSSVNASYVDTNMENRDTDLTLGVKTFNGRFTGTPAKNLSFTANYRRLDYDNPEIEHATSRKHYNGSFELFYRLPKQKLSFKGGYEWERVDRTNHEEHIIPRTRTQTIRFYTNYRPNMKLNAYMRYRRVDVKHPLAFILEESPLKPGVEQPLTILPTDENHLQIGANWTPKPTSSFFVGYLLRDRSNADINSTDDVNSVTVNFWNAPMEKVNLTLGYTYLSNKIKNTIFYGAEAPAAVPAADTPYDSTNHCFLISGNFMPTDKLTLHAEADITGSKVNFNTSNVTAPDIGQLTDMDILQTGLGLGFDYMFHANTYVLAKYMFRKYGDDEFPLDNGRFHLIYLGIRYTL